jgi:hypothetical protein
LRLVRDQQVNPTRVVLCPREDYIRWAWQKRTARFQPTTLANQ